MTRRAARRHRSGAGSLPTVIPRLRKQHDDGVLKVANAGVSAVKRRVLVVTSDHVGKRMAGPAVRAFNIARELAIRGHAVTLATPNSIDIPLDGVVPHRLDFRDARATIALARRHDSVVAQWLAPAAMVSLARSETHVVYDLYDPVLTEVLAS